MSIELHCPRCQQLVKAPDDAGGKRGRCPYCKSSVYIPLPPGEEEIRIAPIDQEDEQREKELRRESAAYVASIAHGGTPKEEPPSTAEEPADPDVEIESFIRAMHESRLDDAEAAVSRIRAGGKQARNHVKTRVSKHDLPALEGIPEPLINAFVKDLLNRLG